jgi:putative membrane protein
MRRWKMMGGFGMGCMWIILIVIVVAVILLATGYVSRTKKAGESTEESALDVLKKRYARGEISKEEFEEKQRDLM